MGKAQAKRAGWRCPMCWHEVNESLLAEVERLYKVARRLHGTREHLPWRALTDQARARLLGAVAAVRKPRCARREGVRI
jgi:hypothetical protein